MQRTKPRINLVHFAVQRWMATKVEEMVFVFSPSINWMQKTTIQAEKVNNESREMVCQSIVCLWPALLALGKDYNHTQP